MKSNYLPWTLLRVVINALAFLLLGFAAFRLSHGKIAPAKADVSLPTLQDIAKDYKEFNKTQFNNKLPANIGFTWTYNPDYRAVTELDSIGFVIKFNPIYNNSLSDMDMHLYHEMCHVSVYQTDPNQFISHGKLFQDCMKHLAQQDAFKQIW